MSVWTRLYTTAYVCELKKAWQWGYFCLFTKDLNILPPDPAFLSLSMQLIAWWLHYVHFLRITESPPNPEVSAWNFPPPPPSSPLTALLLSFHSLHFCGSYSFQHFLFGRKHQNTRHHKAPGAAVQEAVRNPNRNLKVNMRDSWLRLV